MTTPVPAPPPRPGLARLWHGRTPADRADAYMAFLRQRALPDYQGTPGNLGAYLLMRLEGEEAHFLALTFWESEAAIASFAGSDITRAKYYPEDADFLLEFEPRVTHFQFHGGTRP
ncbi:MAG: antibiotic biosynthesis monooxygenase [Acidobacteria bacterium]|nr:antibiotic biosynthesis monooxygenase [Acidobacteriota bacterium]